MDRPSYEKHLAWVPATNDVNEGAWGAYRVTIRGKPFPRRAERQAELQKILQQYQDYILEHGPLISFLLPSNPTFVAIADDWEADEEAEME